MAVRQGCGVRIADGRIGGPRRFAGGAGTHPTQCAREHLNHLGAIAIAALSTVDNKPTAWSAASLTTDNAPRPPNAVRRMVVTAVPAPPRGLGTVCPVTEANQRLDDARLRAALDTLGIRDPHPDEGRRIDNGVLLGILLALTEIAILHDLTDASADSLTRGYRWMVDQSLDGDEADSARLRAQLLQDRLHRSATTSGASGQQTRWG